MLLDDDDDDDDVVVAAAFLSAFLALARAASAASSSSSSLDAYSTCAPDSVRMRRVSLGDSTDAGVVSRNGLKKPPAAPPPPPDDGDGAAPAPAAGDVPAGRLAMGANGSNVASNAAPARET